MSSRTRYIVVSWADHRRRGLEHSPATREYGVASTKQAAIRLAERTLPPDAEYIVTTATRTVHHGRTPPVEQPTPERSQPGRSR
jgi:uncharacterized protein (DUF1810 family)